MTRSTTGTDGRRDLGMLLAALACAAVFLPAASRAAVTASPTVVTLLPGQTSAVIEARVGFVYPDPINEPDPQDLRVELPAPLAGRVVTAPSPVTYFIPSGATSARARFRIVAGTSTPPGVYTVGLVDGSSYNGGSGNLTLRILEAQASLSPAAATLVQGRTSTPIVLRVDDAASGTLSFRSTVPAPLAGNVQVDPQPVTVRVPAGATSGSATFRVRTSPRTPPGRYRIELTDERLGTTASLDLRVLQARARISLAPPSVVGLAGSASPQITLGVADSNLGGQRLVFRPVLPAPLVATTRLEPPEVTVALPTGATAGTASFRILIGPDAPPGRHLVRLVEGAFGFEAALTLDILPPVIVRAVTPTTVAPGAPAVPVRLAGDNFEPGARLVTSSPVLAFGPTRVVSPGSAESVVTVRRDAPPGPYRFRLVNPDGRAGEAMLVVAAGGDPAAPLAVRTAAIVHPVSGALVALGEHLLPRGLLATSGSGPIVGSWLLDGVPFDRFVIQAQGGLPVEVEARMPLPATILGERRLQLAVETPQRILSPVVPVVVVTERAATARLLAPEDGAVLPLGGGLFRWSPVPGVEGYEVEILRRKPLPSLRFRTAAPPWTPSEGQLERIGPGVHRWRVRPVFPGGMTGSPTEARRVVVLPRRVDLEILSPAEPGQVAWRGGLPGLLYRVDYYPLGSQERVFSALTSGPGYRLPTTARARPNAHRVRVTALAPGGVELGRSQLLAVPGPAVAGLVLAAGTARPEILQVEPVDGGSVQDAQPLIRASWDREVSPELVTLIVDDLDVTVLADVTPTSLTYESLLPLEDGSHDAHLVVGETLHSWTFRVEVAGPASTGDEPDEKESAAEESAWIEEPAEASHWRDWSLSAEGTLSLLSADELPDDQLTARGSLSLQADVQGATGYARAAGDVSLAETLEGPDNLSDEQRSWTATAGTRQGDWNGELTVGYAPPDFLFGSQLLTSGLGRGGAQAALSGPWSRLSYYETVDAELAGVASGDFGPEQDVRAGALEVGGVSQPFSLKVVGMEVAEADGLFSVGGEGSILGLLATFTVGPDLRVDLEAARGEYTPGPGSFETESEGNALRLALDGTAGTFAYALALRHTEGGFVNPAARGLTPGGIPDRTGAELSLSKTWQGSSLSFTYRHEEGGGGTAFAAGDSRLDGADLRLSARLGEAVSLSLAGNVTVTRSDADPTLLLPETEQTDWGLSFELSETLGSISLSQSAGFQRSEDDFDPTRFIEVIDLGLSLGGEFSPRFSLWARAGATRSEQDPAFGTTDSFLASLQPAWSLAEAGLRVHSYLSYNRVENDVLGSELETELYQLSITWMPPRLGSHLGFQAAGDWSRSRGAGLQEAGFSGRYSGSLILRWGGGPGREDPDGLPQSVGGSPESGTTPSGVADLVRSRIPIGNVPPIRGVHGGVT